MVQSFFIEGPVVSWNQIVRKHWRVYTNIKEDVASRTLQAVRRAKIVPIKGPLEIEVMAQWKTKRLRDVDNTYVKAVIDLLVSEKIIERDTLNIVYKVTLLGRNGCKREGLSVILSSRY